MGTASFAGLRGPMHDVNHPPTLNRGQRKSRAISLFPLCILMTGCRVNCTLYCFGLLVARKEAETCSVDRCTVSVHYVQSDETFIVDSTAYGIVCCSITVVMAVCTCRLVVCQELSPVKLKSAMQGRLTVQVSNGRRAVSNAG